MSRAYILLSCVAVVGLGGCGSEDLTADAAKQMIKDQNFNPVRCDPNSTLPHLINPSDDIKAKYDQFVANTLTPQHGYTLVEDKSEKKIFEKTDASAMKYTVSYYHIYYNGGTMPNGLYLYFDTNCM